MDGFAVRRGLGLNGSLQRPGGGLPYHSDRGQATPTLAEPRVFQIGDVILALRASVRLVVFTDPR